MQTLSKGYKKPQNPDTGDVVFPALEANWQRVNDHNHDGVNSQYLASVLQTLDASGWIFSGDGNYFRIVTMPGGLTYDNVQMQFRLATGEVVYPSVDRQSSTTYRIWTNDPVDYVAVYR